MAASETAIIILCLMNGGNKMIQNLNKLLIITLCLCFYSCAYNSSLVKTAYDTLSTSQTAYETSMKLVSSLDSQGLLSRSDISKILKTANVYYSAHNSAVEALAVYEESKTKSNEQQLQAQLSSTSKALSNLLKTLKPYLEE